MKTELRFQQPDAVRGALISALRRALGQGAGTSAAPATVSGLAETQLAYAGASTHAWSGGRADAWAEARAPAVPAQPRLAMPMPAPTLPATWETPDAAHPLGRAIAQLMETY
ncbi:MAG: hypothetical protein V4653_19345, partial [Pseudomonadota bacterium]